MDELHHELSRPETVHWTSELRLHTIEVLPHRDNRPSRRAAERAGFTSTGELRRLARMPPGRRDGYLVHTWRSER